MTNCAAKIVQVMVDQFLAMKMYVDMALLVTPPLTNAHAKEILGKIPLPLKDVPSHLFYRLCNDGYCREDCIGENNQCEPGLKLCLDGACRDSCSSGEATCDVLECTGGAICNSVTNRCSCPAGTGICEDIGECRNDCHGCDDNLCSEGSLCNPQNLQCGCQIGTMTCIDGSCRFTYI
jgi:hypothetical protein